MGRHWRASLKRATFRMLHPCRPAMLSVVALGSVVSSLSQRRPCAMDATRSARLSERMGRLILGTPGFWNENFSASFRWWLMPWHFDHTVIFWLPL